MDHTWCEFETGTHGIAISTHIAFGICRIAGLAGIHLLPVLYHVESFPNPSDRLGNGSGYLCQWQSCSRRGSRTTFCQFAISVKESCPCERMQSLVEKKKKKKKKKGREREAEREKSSIVNCIFYRIRCIVFVFICCRASHRSICAGF